MKTEKLESFISGFGTGWSHCSFVCKCGKTFYDCADSCGWEEGELEKFNASDAVALDYSVSSLLIAGKEYAADCDCWHGKAEGLMAWVDHNAQRIADYLKAEKRRKEAEAKHAVEVEL